VKRAGCLIFCARFHRDSLLCSVVVVDSLTPMGDYSHLDCMRPGKTLSGEVSSPDSEPCIDQYRTVGSLIAGHNCSQGSAQGVVILGKRLANYHGLISGIPVHSDRPDQTEEPSLDTGIVRSIPASPAGGRL
jgi:hypothetical protein